jgi:predicted nucleic acid-binding protein
MTGLVFVDTNVLLYSVDTHEGAKHQAARQWMDKLWQDRVGRTSVQVLSEFYVNATRLLSQRLDSEQVWGQVVALSAWEPQPIDFDVLQLGQKVQARHRLSWWDSLVVAAANRQGCGTLLTEDLQHGAVYSGVTALNPFRAGVQEARAMYAPQLDAPTPRGRGRPKKAPLLPALQVQRQAGGD